MSASSSPAVAVVGAGCAGAVAAWHLARSGVATHLFDLGPEPGVGAACGGMMLHALRHRLEMPDGLVDGEVNRIWVISGGRRDRFDFTKPVFVNFDRRRLDAYLVQRAVSAGCHYHPSSRVTGWDPASGELSFTTAGESFRSVFHTAVFADGPASLARRYGLGLGPETATASAFYREIDTAATTPSEAEFYVDLPQDDPGYLWVFPKNGFTQVGVGRLHDVKQRPLRQILDEFVARDPRYSGRRVRLTCGGAIPMGLAQHFSRPGALVVGDAAGLVNPITGGGLLYAVASAEMAALAIIEGIDRAPNDPAVAARRYHQRLVRSPHYWWLRALALPFNHFRRRLRAGSNPHFIGLFLAYARVLPRLTPAACSITLRMPAGDA